MFINVPHMKAKNYPTQDGVYWAGNFNEFHKRLEIDRVILVDGDVITDIGGGFIPSDWTFWSDKIEAV